MLNFDDSILSIVGRIVATDHQDNNGKKIHSRVKPCAHDGPLNGCLCLVIVRSIVIMRTISILKHDNSSYIRNMKGATSKPITDSCLLSLLLVTTYKLLSSNRWCRNETVVVSIGRFQWGTMMVVRSWPSHAIRFFSLPQSDCRLRNKRGPYFFCFTQ